MKTEEKFTRKIEFSPAWDKRNPDPKKNYGVHGMEMKFILKGEKGAVQFVIYTNWHLPHVSKEFEKDKNASLFLKPLPADVGYHSYVPQYEGQEKISDNCPYLEGKPCYYDGSGLKAMTLFDLFVELGEEAMWSELEEFYHYNLGGGKNEN